MIMFLKCLGFSLECLSCTIPARNVAITLLFLCDFFIYFFRRCDFFAFFTELEIIVICHHFFFFLFFSPFCLSMWSATLTNFYLQIVHLLQVLFFLHIPLRPLSNIIQVRHSFCFRLYKHNICSVI